MDSKNLRELRALGGSPIGPTGRDAAGRWLNQRQGLLDATGRTFVTKDQVDQLRGLFAAGTNGVDYVRGGGPGKWVREYVASPVMITGAGADRQGWVATDQQKRAKGTADYDLPDPGGTYNYNLVYTSVDLPDLDAVRRQELKEKAAANRSRAQELQEQIRAQQEQARLDALEAAANGQPPPSTTAPPPGGTPAGGGIALNPALGYELYGTVGGQGVTFEQARAAGAGASWYLLDSQADAGAGFRLAAQAQGLAQQRFPGQTPAQYGLTAWVFAQGQQGPAVAPAATLRSLGIRV